MSESSHGAESSRSLEEELFVPEPEPVTERELTIVKVGTDAAPDWESVLQILAEVEALRSQLGRDVIIVWSRGVRQGMEMEGLDEYPTDLTEIRFLSGLGWPNFVERVGEHLEKRPLGLAITRQDLRDPKTHARLHEMIRYALAEDRLVLINEDDTRSDEELEKVGTIDYLDNDGLARRIGTDTMATRWVIVTDVPGVYDKDPKVHGDAQKFDRISAGESLSVDTTGKSDGGRGGMTSKQREIELAREAGIEVFVTDAKLQGQIVAAVHPHYRFRGTHFEAHPRKTIQE